VSSTTDFRELERDFDVWFEEGPWLVLLLLPLAALCFRRGWLWSLPLLLILPQERAEASLWDDLWATRDQQAQQALNQGDAATAASLFKDEAWRAAARYRSEDYAGAANDYAQQISETSGSSDDAYNLGNSLARLGEYEDAIKAYEQALARNPDDADAAANKQLIEDILQQQQDQESSEDGDEQDSEDESSDQDSEPGDPNDQEQSDSDQSADEDGEPQDDESTEAEPQQPADQDQAAKDPKMAEEDTQPLDDEERQALENWLRKVPDDPGGLLRRKFETQYSDRLRQGRSNNNGNQSNW